MSHLPEIPTSAYTPEMETLGAIPDIPTFDGEPVPVSRNPLTSGTRPMQLLPLPGTEFPVCYETSRMRGFQTEASFLRTFDSCVTQLFCGRTVPSRDCSSTRQGLGQLRAQLLRCVAQLWRYVAHLFFRVRNLGKLRDAAM
ncbi:hypothetical protein JCGZ_10465 [Jatropha curcas]|uniref:Uncharacterized protein n=1 Tax=Jatropha curcas TaxID=180498 RepID=A0A067KIE8_JATCU|nr:hypothetical protein JCGZ_10465 [Jatropha curcas]